MDEMGCGIIDELGARTLWTLVVTEKLGMNGVEKDCNQYDSNMTAESGREGSRFKSWQKQDDWLTEISAECDRFDE